MPPIRTQTPSNSEGRLDLAVDAIYLKKITSVRQAARVYDVSRSTLSNHLQGVKSRVNTRANRCKLTLYEEETLKQWILSLDRRGASPRQPQVREIANILLADRGDSTPSTIGLNWVQNFVNRHEGIRMVCSRRYDYQHALMEDPKVRYTWFQTVKQTIEDNGIDINEIYNFDEIGFAMGIAAHARVITRAGYYGKKNSYYNLEIANGLLQLNVYQQLVEPFHR